MKRKKCNNVGNMMLEFKEIEKFNLKKDSISLYEITYGSGSFLTILCCKP